MRVLQLIDSLRSGGAERMSVNYANALAKRIDHSFLCCTRMEGLLKQQLSPEVGYLFLNKKSTQDLQAFLKLRKFVRKNKINLIQAHSSSWFLALLVKLSLPNVKLIWHDHYGRDLNKRKAGLLKPGSRFFDGIISVNTDLKAWAENNLDSKNVQFFRNFLPEVSLFDDPATPSPLKGGEEEFRIVCLANLRPQKDHLNLLQAFKLVVREHPRTSLHLVGKDEHDDYSGGLKSFVSQNHLENKVFFYGEQQNVEGFLKGADLGVLSSASEGLPLALLEYGRTGLPVVCTDVGECAEVIENKGKLIPPGDAYSMAQAIKEYIQNTQIRNSDGFDFQQVIKSNCSEEVLIAEVLNFFKTLNVKP